MLDKVLLNGKIHDGSGSPPYAADIGIKGDRIACIGHLKDAPAAEKTDIRGKNVLPGMIDVHTHTDIQFINAPDRSEALLQGITTEVTGACGIGVFPLTDGAGEYLPTMRAILGDEIHAYKSCAAYFDAVPASGTNIAVQVSHSPLRMEAAGCADRPLTGKETERMRALAQEAFEEGACGMSTGLSYYPAAFGGTDEAAALCGVAAEFDAPVSVHQRSVFRTPYPGFDPREEVLEFARRSGARLQYSHYRTTPETVGRTDELLEPIRRGLKEGLRITADFYPYPVGAGYTAVMLPMWVMADGFGESMRKLKDPANKERILRAIRDDDQGLIDSVVTHCPNTPEFLGLSYRQISDETGMSVPEVIFRLLTDNDLDVGYRKNTDFDPGIMQRQELDFITCLREPYYMLGSDTLPGQMKPHPRCYGAFARMLRLSEKHGLDLALFADRVCRLPAGLLGIRDRGVIREGAYADLCVFAPGRVAERSTFDDPRQTAVGMDLVLVNGQTAVRDGKATGIRAGKKLRRGKA